MRVVGYVREAPGPEDGQTIFAQTEQVRRWVLKNRYHLIAMCQDPRSAEHPSQREGYRALLGILDASQADTVVVPSLDSFSADKIDQEIMLNDLRRRGASVVVTHDGDADAMAEPAPDPARGFIRDVLRKTESYSELLEEHPASDEPEVLVELVRPDGPTGGSGRDDAQAS